MIRFRTFGGLDIQAADGKERRALLAQPKRVALLAYLAIATPRGLHRRDTLLALFWPELDDAHARGALSQALTFLRSALGSDALLNRGLDEIGLDPERFSCDAVEFEKRIAAGSEAEALALYRGDLLEGFFISDAPAFERWLDAERRRMRELARSSAARLANRCEQAADIGGALGWARRALDLEPHDEPTLRRVVELLDRSGDRAGAMREYEAFAIRLREELDVEPSPESRTAIEAIRVRATSKQLLRTEPAARTATGASERLLEQSAIGERSYARITRGVRTLAAVALLLLLGYGASLLAIEGRNLDSRRVVVFPFHNMSFDPALEPVRRITSDWIRQGLVRSEVLDVVPSTDVSERIREFQRAKLMGPGMMSFKPQALAMALGAGTAIVGDFRRVGDSLEFRMHVFEVRHGHGILHFGTRGALSDPMTAIDELRRKVLAAIALRFDSRAPRGLYSAVRPPTYEAYQAFAAGEDLRDRGEWSRAVTYFRTAYSLDTSFTAALTQARNQHVNLHEYAQADSLTRLLRRSR